MSSSYYLIIYLSCRVQFSEVLCTRITPSSAWGPYVRYQFYVKQVLYPPYYLSSLLQLIYMITFYFKCLSSFYTHLGREKTENNKEGSRICKDSLFYSGPNQYI